jgi:hypothetical protein
MQVHLDDPYILIHDKKLANLQAILPVLESVVQTGNCPGPMAGCALHAMGSRPTSASSAKRARS